MTFANYGTAKSSPMLKRHRWGVEKCEVMDFNRGSTPTRLILIIDRQNISICMALSGGGICLAERHA